MVGAIGGWLPATVTVALFVALGPTPFPQVMVKVVVVVNVPEFLLPLATGVTDPTPLSIEQVMVPPPVIPLHESVLLDPYAMLPGEAEKEPIATLARQAFALHVVPAAQLTVSV
jgi:hypothetical protein